MKKNWRLIILLAAGGAAIYFAFAIHRARSNLVSLNVHEADLQQVVHTIEWQTWEDILVEPGVQGKVTLNVHRVPLEEVLRIIEQQTAARWTAVYPLYTSKKSLAELKQVVQGDLPASQSQWRAWAEEASLANFRRFVQTLRDDNQWVNARFEGKDVEFVASALSRFSRAHVVPEDGTDGTINLKLAQVTLPEAVTQLARRAHRQWTVFYLLEAGRFANRPSRVNSSATNGTDRAVEFLTGSSDAGSNRQTLSPEQKAAIEKKFEARLATMTPAESNRAVEVRQRTELVRSLPPEQRLEAIQQLTANPEAQSRIQQTIMNRITGAIKDATPEQRVERTRALNEMRKQLQLRSNSNP